MKAATHEQMSTTMIYNREALEQMDVSRSFAWSVRTNLNGNR
ncbi:hypothetical protein CHELA20_54401 [Hyphomicrobiales bacterium]|nr:hypothetical protein CHELA41_20527 [Hyphomicrobiales bacterium]CAH1686190.1 hypothetical protein CHELA20_54401 [Hyphomicrobiales bacterium]